jgi:hypothetical protein
MRTWELHTDDGRPFGIEISNLNITRGGVVRTIERIPGATVTSGKRYSERRRDDFCHFTLHGASFIAEEPFGDNSRYWIYAEVESGFAFISAIQRAFEQRKIFSVA